MRRLKFVAIFLANPQLLFKYAGRLPEVIVRSIMERRSR